MIYLLSTLLLLLGVLPSAHASTRLGLFQTQEEVFCWRQRAGLDSQGANGITCPVRYKTTGDVSTNSPGDWDRIVSKKNTFVANPSSDRWDGTALLQGNGCVDRNASYTPPVALPQSTLSLGEGLMSAAFYAFLVNDTTVRTAVRNELIAQAGTAGTNFANTAKFCVAETNDANPFFQIAIWLAKLLHAYDYVRSQLSAGDQTTLNTWFSGAATWIDASMTRMRNTWFVDPNGGNYTATSGALNDCNLLLPVVYFGGPATTGMSGHYNNRSGDMAYFVVAAGVLLGNTTLTTHGHLWFEEWIKYGVYSEGSPDDMNRWQTTAPTQGFRYSGGVIGAAVTAADVLARNGDTSLYTYATSTGLCTPGTSGGPKSLQMIVDNYYKYVDIRVTRYGTNQSGQQDLTHRIDTIDAVDGQSSIRDIYSTQANVYFNNATWKTIYMRTAAGAPAYPASAEGGGYEPWGGNGGKFPGLLFMFGQMEGVVDPYNLSVGGPTPPVLLRLLR